MCYRVRASAGQKVREGHENVVRMPGIDPERVGGFGIGALVRRWWGKLGGERAQHLNSTSPSTAPL